MEPPRTQNDSLTPSQRQAVEARGNVLVMAGAGTGKTRTLVARCLDCLDRERASLDELLIVTFTEAAAAELRQRLRRAIEEKVAAESLNFQLSTLNFWQEQLARFDIAHIGTLHSFCLRLVREHFYELGLDPQLATLDEGEARQLASETLDEQFQAHYEGEDEFSLAVQNLIQVHGGGRDEKIRALILRLHHYSQTRPDAAGWLAEQINKFSASEPIEWQNWLLAAIEDWRDEWLAIFENLKSGNEKAAELTGILSRLKKNFTRELAAEVLEQIVSADGNWPAKKKTILRKPLEDLFDEAAFLAALVPVKNGNDPLAEDWNWVRGQMETLLRLAQKFAQKFAARKLDDGVLDFHDLEQFALELLWNFPADQPTAVAELWRKKLQFVFVDEYQDINAAQDKIIAALARDASSPSPLGGERAGVRGPELANNPPPHPDPLLLLGGEGEEAQAQDTTIGNRFLVGDVKQSIYRFRLADPKIFRDYATNWRGKNGQTIPLTENFRSRESLLNFVNSIFEPLMREEIGGVNYDEDAKLKPGNQWSETPGEPAQNDASTTARGDARATNDEPRTELLLRFKAGRGESSEPDEESDANELADLGETEKEARLLVTRLKQLQTKRQKIWDDEEKKFRAVEWRDMAVLLRAMSGKSEIYALEFERAGVPLVIARGGFYDSSEISDLLSLLQMLDNPLQDVPCIAVLRSPLVGLSLDELAAIRLTVSRGYFWTALNGIKNEKLKIKDETVVKVAKFLERFSRWRKLARQASLSQCLESVLAETHYEDWLKSRPRGAQRHANVGRFLNLAQKFDQFQRQGLYRFLKFIETQREAEIEPEVSPVADENAVRLMSIHQSKGLEFPVVAIADLAKNFNTQDLRGEIIFDEEFGLCPKVKPPQTGRRYPSLPHWLAQRHQRREQAGEELRLLYVAMTRARDTLILTGSITEKKWETLWADAGAITSQKILAAKSYADWLGLWFGVHSSGFSVQNARQGELPHLRWRIADDADLLEANVEDRSQKAEGELPELNDETLQKLRETLTWQYGFRAATERAAKSSVTALRRQAADEADDEAEQIFKFQFSAKRLAGTFAPPGQNRKSEIGNRKLTAAAAGTAHHKFLQHISLSQAGGLAALEAEAGRLEREKVLSADERAALDLNAVAAFWNSETGKRIRQQAPNVRRELAFTARFSPQELDELIRSSPGDIFTSKEFVVVQGVADLVVLLPQEIWLVDFKTDETSAGDLPAKIKTYALQLKLYARALERIYSRPVTNCWLHFLPAQQTEHVKI
jgi:ATP-dependent helicase/nuclease subunit A